MRAFVDQHLRSITQLDLLLALHAQGDAALTAGELSRTLRAPERLVSALLVDFYAAGVVGTDESETPRWHLERGGRHSPVVDELAECVRVRKRTVHDLILGGLDSDITAFSDAFRLRGDD